MRNRTIPAGVCILLFLALILAVKTIDIQVIGPEATSIGLATINGMIHEATGVQMTWYKITSYLGILSILVGVCFACVGLVQLIRRRSLLKVDAEILSLGCLYVILAVLYILFEFLIINERPIIMPGDEHVEASFPSSHTLLSFVILGSAMIVIGKYVRSRKLCILIQAVSGVLILIAVFGRLLSGVQWFTDILGSIFLSVSLLFLFAGSLDLAERRNQA